RDGVFAIGNLLHPVDTADIAALDGRHVTESVRSYLGGRPPVHDGVRILTDAPLRWISPGVLRPGDSAPARNRLLLWTDTLVRIPKIVVRQDGKVIARKTLLWPASPGRVFRVPSSVLDKADTRGGPVTVSLG
ncbi:pyridine nucleotide-disulfide oxidoreductase, partial [Rhodococcus sp. NPDC059968]